jgi:hypothetical protein
MKKIILLMFVLFTISFSNDGSATNYTTENINIEDTLRDSIIIKDTVSKGYFVSNDGKSKILKVNCYKALNEIYNLAVEKDMQNLIKENRFEQAKDVKKNKAIHKYNYFKRIHDERIDDEIVRDNTKFFFLKKQISEMMYWVEKLKSLPGISKNQIINAIVSNNPEENLEDLLVSYTLPDVSKETINKIKQKLEVENKKLLEIVK